MWICELVPCSERVSIFSSFRPWNVFWCYFIPSHSVVLMLDREKKMKHCDDYSSELNLFLLLKVWINKEDFWKTKIEISFLQVQHLSFLVKTGIFKDFHFHSPFHITWSKKKEDKFYQYLGYSMIVGMKNTLSNKNSCSALSWLLQLFNTLHIVQ